MPVCPACGLQCAEEALFCSRCAEPLVEAPGDERRALVTVVFADLAGSTALGERLDPEVMRNVQLRYFAACSAALQHHGGQVEKYIGDAVMCVFGLPRAHEDDAARGCRAALDLVAAVDSLSDALEQELGVRLRVRVGVDTGEVVVGLPRGGQALATGGAVNTAARLEQAASPGEVLIGELTRRLAGGVVEAEQVASVRARGKREPVPAHRLLLARPGRPGGGHPAGSPFVGRERELALVSDAVARVVAARGCEALVVVGEAGIGKSRLVAEASADLPAGVRLLRGRCLSYGTGVAFWPLREIVDALGAEAPLTAALQGDPDPPWVVDRLLRLTGRADRPVTTAESTDAVARLFAAVAARTALVCVIEDLQWAEPALLDLLERLVGRAVATPMLLVGTARPEFAASGWPLAHGALVLSALGREAAFALVAAGNHDLSPDRRDEIVAAAGGNPLFLEQLRAVAEEDPLPPDIRGLLAARIDELEGPERSLLEAAAIAGREFWPEALSQLVPDGARELAARLGLLSRAGFVSPGRADQAAPAGITGVFEGERYAFHHALVREAVLAGLPRGRAASLHERFAELLQGASDAPPAIAAWHLEQAARLRLALEPRGKAPAVAARAADALDRAGRSALERDDPRAATGLLSRAAHLAAIAGLPDTQLDAVLARSRAAAERLARGDPELLRPGEVLGGFEVEAVAGHGGMGVVYRARDLALGRRVALKVITPALARDPAFVERFRRESRIAARIEHPNVVPVFAAGQDAGRLFIAMRYIDGIDLAALLARNARLTPVQAADVIGQVGRALDAAHAHGLVHRDVKPANVLLTDADGERRAYLTDFGLTVERGGQDGLTRSGQWVGTVAYVAPEQIRGRDVGPRTDVYALGGVLHHCLTGQPPFPCEHELDALAAHLSEPPPRPSAIARGVPSAFDGVVATALAKSPEQRFATAGELGDAAAAAARGDHPRRSSARPPGRLLRRIRSPEGALTALGLSAVAAASLIALSVGGGGRPAATSRAGVTAQRPIRLQHTPDRIEMLGDRLWALTTEGGTLARVDTTSRRAAYFLSPVHLAAYTFPGLAVGAGSVWTTEAATFGGVTRIDPGTGEATARLRIRDGAVQAAVGAGAAWATSGSRGSRQSRLLRIDTGSNRITDTRARVGREPADMAIGAGAVWVADRAGDAVVRVDLDTGRTNRIVVGDEPAAIAAGRVGVWVLNSGDRTLSRIDPARPSVVGAPVSPGKELEDIVLAGGDLWLAAADSTVTRLDPISGAPRAGFAGVGRPPLALAADGDGVWVASATDLTVRRLRPEG